MDLTSFENLLNTGYLNRYDTCIKGGFSEPLYKAGDENKKAEIQFTRDYIRSALHELGHWLVAGKKRREVDDFGYWYQPDGRNQDQQNEFYKLEVKPQAIEWALCKCLGIDFEVSEDNLNQEVDGGENFEQAVKEQLTEFEKTGFPRRTQELIEFLNTLEKKSVTNKNLA